MTIPGQSHEQQATREGLEPAGRQELVGGSAQLAASRDHGSAARRGNREGHDTAHFSHIGHRPAPGAARLATSTRAPHIAR
ncbi:MAG: hypothetical protein ACRDTX_08530 [Pseudonocardiaceae bacterium]